METIQAIKEKPNFVSRKDLRIDQPANLGYMAAELKRQRQTKKDFIAPADKIFITPTANDLELSITGTGTYEITPQCHAQLASKLEIPQGYYDRLKASSPALLSDNVNHWMKKENPKLIRTLDGKARAFLSDRYKIMDNDDIFFMSIDEMQKGSMQFFRADLTDSYLFIKAVSTTTQAEIRNGDVVQAGIMIKNSEIGLSRFQVEPFILRLVCLNGLILPDSNGINKTHIGRKMEEGVYSRETQELNALTSISEMRDIVRATINGDSFNQTVRLLTAASEAEIEKPSLAISNISTYAGFNDAETENILYNFIHGNDTTKYGLVNAITSTAKNAETAERMTEIERKASEVITLSDDSFDEIVSKKLKKSRGNPTL